MKRHKIRIRKSENPYQYHIIRDPEHWFIHVDLVPVSTVLYGTRPIIVHYLTSDYCVSRVGEVRIAAARRRRRRGQEPPKPPRLCSAPAAPFSRSRTRTPPPPERSTLSSRRIRGDKEVLTFCYCLVKFLQEFILGLIHLESVKIRFLAEEAVDFLIDKLLSLVFTR